ncbi:MAG: fibronectin type III domain-containing protein, partial [Elusimicrobia bacterium]|nr:fibronectin type III domain-containing protein [Elusimicrobiota bacterium]
MAAKIRSWARLTRAATLLASLVGLSFALAPRAAARTSDGLTVTFTPRDATPPGAIKDLAASPGGEGQMLLQWTAPDGDGNLFASSTTVAGYIVRIATFSADSVASTTTWWNAAEDVPGPTPSAPGTTDTLLLNNLEPGATYYAAIKSSDSAGNFSPIDVKTATAGQQAFALIFDAPPPAVTGLKVTSASTTTVSLSWTPSGASDLWYYHLYIDSTSPYDFADAYSVAVASSSASALLGGLDPSTTYFFRVAAVDKGAPLYKGHALEGAFSNVVSTMTASLPAPLAPLGVVVSSQTISWYPVQDFADGKPFADPNHATVYELSGYRVFRATAPAQAPWTRVVSVSSMTLSYTDAGGSPQSFYYVNAYNKGASSQPSLVRSAQTGSEYIVGYDGYTTFQVPEPIANVALDGQGTAADAYYVQTSSHPEDIGDGVLKSVEFTPQRGGLVDDPAHHLNGAGVLSLHYDVKGGKVVASGVSPADVSATPDSLSVFWYNGIKWLQLYGKVDAPDQLITVQTPYLGRYQIRAAERTGGFSFDTAGLSNRMLTPNGDGRNDTTIFKYDNPRGSEVTGKIYDIRGRFVSDMMPGPVGDSLQWDGKSGGRVVPG